MPFPNKKKEDDLIREPRGEVAEYKRDTHPTSNVSRSTGPTTIVPRGGEIDKELKPKTQVEDAGMPQQPQYMYDGDIVKGDEEDTPQSSIIKPSQTPYVNLNGGANTAEDDTPPAPMLPPPPPPISSVPKPVAQAPSKPLPGMPPSITPEELSGYLNKQKTDLNKFGPEQQMALQQAMDQRRNSLGYKLQSGGKGLADAIMMGVARAGNPGFQQQFENQENEGAKERMETLRGAQEGNFKRLEAGMSLDKMDPNSPTSKAAQDAYSPLFQKLGYNPAALKKMSASDITSALSLMSEYGGKELEAQIKAYEMQIENRKTDAMMANIMSETENRKSQRQMEEKKLRAEHPYQAKFGMLGGTDENSTNASSHPQADAALKWAKDNPNDPRATTILQRLNR